jgi:hypothetical protein
LAHIYTSEVGPGARHHYRRKHCPLLCDIISSSVRHAKITRDRYGRAKIIQKNAGAKDIFRTGYFAAHPGGTAKVGDLVDSNLKTEYDNLYVCDCL